MKEFQPTEIKGARDHFTALGFPVEERQIKDLPVKYFVLPQTLSSDLQDFALRMTYTDPTTKKVEGIFGVSDSVPAELRPYWAAHEVIEFTQVGISTKGRCAISEQRVVEMLPNELRDAYVARRVDFFSNLAEYFRKDLASGSNNYTQDDINEAEASLVYLQGLQARN